MSSGVARFQETSPDDRIQHGPDWAKPMVEGLRCFCVGKFTIYADTGKVFLQVRVRDKNGHILFLVKGCKEQR